MTKNSDPSRNNSDPSRNNSQRTPATRQLVERVKRNARRMHNKEPNRALDACMDQIARQHGYPNFFALQKAAGEGASALKPDDAGVKTVTGIHEWIDYETDDPDERAAAGGTGATFTVICQDELATAGKILLRVAREGDTPFGVDVQLDFRSGMPAVHFFRPDGGEGVVTAYAVAEGVCVTPTEPDEWEQLFGNPHPEVWDDAAVFFGADLTAVRSPAEGTESATAPGTAAPESRGAPRGNAYARTADDLARRHQHGPIEKCGVARDPGYVYGIEFHQGDGPSDTWWAQDQDERDAVYGLLLAQEKNGDGFFDWPAAEDRVNEIEREDEAGRLVKDDRREDEEFGAEFVPAHPEYGRAVWGLHMLDEDGEIVHSYWFGKKTERDYVFGRLIDEGYEGADGGDESGAER